MTNTVDELRILQLDAKGKGSSMPGPHSDEQWRCGDQQRLAQQQHDSESDCSDYESGTTESDADEDAGGTSMPVRVLGCVCLLVQDCSVFVGVILARVSLIRKEVMHMYQSGLHWLLMF